MLRGLEVGYGLIRPLIDFLNQFNYEYAVNPSLGDFISSFLLRPAYSMKAIFGHGYLPKFAEATTMMPAEFLIAPDGTVKLAHYGRDLGDYVPLDTLYQLLEEMTPIGSVKSATEQLGAL